MKYFLLFISLISFAHAGDLIKNCSNKDEVFICKGDSKNLFCQHFNSGVEDLYKALTGTYRGFYQPGKGSGGRVLKPNDCKLKVSMDESSLYFHLWERSKGHKWFPWLFGGKELEWQDHITAQVPMIDGKFYEEISQGFSIGNPDVKVTNFENNMYRGLEVYLSFCGGQIRAIQIQTNEEVRDVPYHNRDILQYCSGLIKQ